MDKNKNDELILNRATLFDELHTLQILIRVNNLLLSKLINEWNNVKTEMGLPRRYFSFKFSILKEEYDELAKIFGEKEVQKALYKLDRLLITNKQNCPTDIKKYIQSYLKRNKAKRDRYESKKNETEER